MKWIHSVQNKEYNYGLLARHLTRTFLPKIPKSSLPFSIFDYLTSLFFVVLARHEMQKAVVSWFSRQ
jgi:hypothetical protein